MKYVVFLGDGMADFPNEGLGGKTPLELAHKPYMDELAKKGTMGLAKTVDDSLSPGSDVANLSVLGYDPLSCYTGRSPLEALSIGVDLKETDVTFRANIVTVSDEDSYEDKTMVDYSAGEISTKESSQLIAYLRENLVVPGFSLYAGVSYRHLLVWDKGSLSVKLTPPHDISKRPVKDYLPAGEQGSVLYEIMKKSHELLKDHPINKERIRQGKNPGNSLWIWGEGTKPRLDNFTEKFSIRGAMISAVDLLKGIGVGTGMEVIEVPDVTGN
ncbi:MAG: 2,3-bisphosphoglycerate-independent phosphoglycerate mutase, partial [Clostridia bacterium]|nr:2,3-bisphosphoglycerate-independent phosphoglycerate mutase [Clostridia bacterium]